MNDVRPVQIVTSGQDSGHGNLLGIQPWMMPADYATADTVYTALAGYLARARREGWLNAKTIVVWPENLGTWLVTTGGPDAVRDAQRLSDAMRALALRQPFRLLREFLRSSEQDRLTAALLRLNADAVAHRYTVLFSQLARDYQVTMVAGSVLLPEPRVQDGRVTAGRGPLANVSAVFRPDGTAYPDLVRKAHPVGTELAFLAPGHVRDLPVFQTRAGRLGVLICADSWYPETYAHLRSKSVELLAVPSHVGKPGAWESPWLGYSGMVQADNMPQDVDLADVGRLTERQAWRAYALAGRIAQSGASAGINVFLGGKLWDLGAEGQSMAVLDGQSPVEVERDTPALLNLWL